MSQDFTRNLIWSALENYVQEQIDSGSSQDEIQTKVDELDVQKLTIETVEQIAKDCISSIQENMYERVLEDRRGILYCSAERSAVPGGYPPAGSRRAAGYLA